MDQVQNKSQSNGKPLFLTPQERKTATLRKIDLETAANAKSIADRQKRNAVLAYQRLAVSMDEGYARVSNFVLLASRKYTRERVNTADPSLQSLLLLLRDLRKLHRNRGGDLSAGVPFTRADLAKRLGRRDGRPKDEPWSVWLIRKRLGLLRHIIRTKRVDRWDRMAFWIPCLDAWEKSENEPIL